MNKFIVYSVLAVDLGNLDFYLIAYIHHVFHLFHSALSHLGNVQKAFLARKNLEDCADVLYPHYSSFVDFAYFHFFGQKLYFAASSFCSFLPVSTRFAPSLA